MQVSIIWWNWSTGWSDNCLYFKSNQWNEKKKNAAGIVFGGLSLYPVKLNILILGFSTRIFWYGEGLNK